MREALPGHCSPRPIIVAEDASATFGGEAVLPLHYFRLLRRRGVDVHLVVHARNREALVAAFPHELPRMHFVPDTWLHRGLWGITCRVPSVVGRVFTGPLMNLLTQWRTRQVARRLVRRYGLNLVHQPTPVSPKAPSMMFGLGVPVVIGPMNGGMSFPDGFRRYESMLGALLVRLARWASHAVHLVVRGKREAHTLLVANERTRRALPRGVRGRVIELVENGVDFTVFTPPDAPRSGGGPTRFVFAGRLVNWKGVDHLLRAMKLVVAETPAELEVLGDGVERGRLEALRDELGLQGVVHFRGWLAQTEVARRLRQADVFVLPSLWECGGAVVLEAMAAGVPVIATDWGGPADYLDAETGVLVPPKDPRQFPLDLARAMINLACDPALRRRLGDAAAAKVRLKYDWERKIDRILEIYESAVCADTVAGRPAGAPVAGRLPRPAAAGRSPGPAPPS